MDVSYNELEVKDCGITKLECLNFKVKQIEIRWGQKMENHTRRFVVLPIAKSCLVQPLSN
jgi:hypothetical protein